MRRMNLIVILAGLALALLASHAAAMYSPTLGKFLQRDPIGYGDGTNMYQALGANPIKHNDPTGKQRIIAILNGQDFLGLGDNGHRDHYSVGSTFSETLAVDKDNIVKLFEEDGDWVPQTAQDWISQQENKTPNKDADCSPHTIIIIGHSNGADGARKVAAALKNRTYKDTGKHYRVQLLVLFDPIGKPWHPGPNATEKVSSNVDEAIDYHQRAATFHVLGFLLQGYQIAPGTNVEWNPVPAQFNQNGWAPHINIPDHGSYPSGRLFKDEVIDKIKALPRWQPFDYTGGK
jgi:hypothetical protein